MCTALWPAQQAFVRRLSGRAGRHSPTSAPFSITHTLRSCPFSLHIYMGGQVCSRIGERCSSQQRQQQCATASTVGRHCRWRQRRRPETATEKRRCCPNLLELDRGTEPCGPCSHHQQVKVHRLPRLLNADIHLVFGAAGEAPEQPRKRSGRCCCTSSRDPRRSRQTGAQHGATSRHCSAALVLLAKVRCRAREEHDTQHSCAIQEPPEVNDCINHLHLADAASSPPPPPPPTVSSLIYSSL
jgi:hypothetical protein